MSSFDMGTVIIPTQKGATAHNQNVLKTWHTGTHNKVSSGRHSVCYIILIVYIQFLIDVFTALVLRLNQSKHFPVNFHHICDM